MMAVRRPARKSPPATAEERLLVEAAQSDPAQFDALYELHFERVYYFLASRVRNHAIAEDLTSEVFYKALANLPKFEWRDVPFSAWLFRIAQNAMKDQFKRDIVRAADDLDDPSELTENPRPRTGPPVRDLETIEAGAHLFRLLARLPEVQRRVVHERFVEQRSIREIAQRLKKTEGAIKQLQFRALQSLRAQMEGSHA